MKDCKTFKDIKKGDKIYYWDKGKLHEQIVHEAKLETQTRTYTDWYGQSHEDKREIFHLVAGKNDRTIMELHYDMNDSTFIYNHLRRFACKEAALKWLTNRATEYRHKMSRLTKRLNRYQNTVNAIAIAVKELS